MIYYFFSHFSVNQTHNLKASLEVSSEMYFVAYLVNERMHIVVPHSWISGVNAHIAHFINRGINSNIKVLVFWTNNDEAFNANGAPRVDYQPNQNASLTSTFPNDGWYQCYLRRFNRK